MSNDFRRDEEPPDPLPVRALAPPSYASLAIPPSTSTAPRRVLHQSSTPRPPVEHKSELCDSRGVPWATLKLLSNVASSGVLPSYFDGQTVTGAVELALTKPETIQAVSITFSGTIVATNANPLTFWDLTHVLWSTDMGDPRSPTVSHPESSSGSHLAVSKHSAKLVGAYSWPFAITLPTNCTVPLRSKQPPVSLRLPPSFSEKGAAQFINYEIVVRLRRGAMRIDNKLGTQIGFTPRMRPPAPSLLRRLAYQENSPPLGPEADPDGWEVLPPLSIRGKVFGVRSIEAICTFAFAKPLTYTRGTPIPCSLVVSCEDKQALDLIFTPFSTSVYFIREVLYDASNSNSNSNSNWSSVPSSLDSSPTDISTVVNASTPAPSNSFSFISRSRLFPPLSRTSTSTSASTSHSTGPSLSAPSPQNSRIAKGKKQRSAVAPKLELRGARKAVACAVWWPSTCAEPDRDARAGRRHMDGEILLPKDLSPSFAFGDFSVTYQLALLPFQAPGFEPAPSAREPVLLSRAEVCALHTPGPLPRSYAPPGIEAQRAAHEERVQKPMVWGLYNNSYAGTRE